MNKTRNISRYILKRYRGKLAAIFLLNIVSVLLSVFVFMMIEPFARLLFRGDLSDLSPISSLFVNKLGSIVTLDNFGHSMLIWSAVRLPFTSSKTCSAMLRNGSWRLFAVIWFATYATGYMTRFWPCPSATSRSRNEETSFQEPSMMLRKLSSPHSRLSNVLSRIRSPYCYTSLSCSSSMRRLLYAYSSSFHVLSLSLAEYRIPCAKSLKPPNNDLEHCFPLSKKHSRECASSKDSMLKNRPRKTSLGLMNDSPKTRSGFIARLTSLRH